MCSGPGTSSAATSRSASCTVPSSGRLAAVVFSLFATLDLAEVNIRIWLTRFLQSCADDGGRVPFDIHPSLPWNMSSEQRREMAIASDDSS